MSLLTALAVSVLAALAWNDFRHRRLPNKWVLAYGLLCPPALFIQQAEGAVWVAHAVVAISGFAVLLGLFAFGGMGGGDVKLGTAVLAWAGPQAVWPALFVTGLAGLALALMGLMGDRWLGRHGMAGAPAARRIARALSARRGVPYGVALALGGMAALPFHW